MSLEVIFDSIRQQFSPSEGQTLIRSLQKDPLVWQFIQDDDVSLSYLQSGPKELDAYRPWKLAARLIQQGTDADLAELNTLESALPEDLVQRVNLAYESTLNSGLPPADLLNAGLLALALLEKRRQHGSWHGISDEILFKQADQDLFKNYLIWRTPFACLYDLCQDFDDLVDDFLGSKAESIVSASIPVMVHSLLANPMELQTLLDHLYQFSHALSIDHQLETLRWLDEFNRPSLRESLAKLLIQTKANIDLFSKVFAELESITTHPNGVDPLDKRIRYTLPEDLNRLAAFNYYSGSAHKASELYQKSSDLLGSIKSQTLFQSLVSDGNRSTPSNWLGIIKSIPDSIQARLLYIRSLIQQQNFDEARKYLAGLPDSNEKSFLQSRIDYAKKSHTDSQISLDSLKNIGIDSPRKMIGYYPLQAENNTNKEILKAAIDSETLNIDPGFTDELIEKHQYDPEIMTLLRDGLFKSHQYNKAIELTSYLALAEPDEKTHRRMLAELYCQAERWQDAYQHLQQLVKSDSAPEIEDLEKFAQAALKTDHVDMTVSICQNILKDSPHNSKALVLLGEAYMVKGDSVKAIQHMEQVVKMIPDEAETWLALARLWEGNGQSDRAFEILNQGLLALPQSSKLMLAVGKEHLNRQSPADGLSCLKKAFIIEPDNDEIKLNLAKAGYQLGQYEQAWQLLEPFMKGYEQDPVTAKLLGNVLLAMDRKQTAEPVLLIAAQNYPEDLEMTLTAAHVSLSLIDSSYECVDKDKIDQLQEILEYAQEKNPYNEGIQLHLADLKRLKGQHQEAMDMYIALSEMDQSQNKAQNWQLSYGLGQAAIALGNHEIGLAALQEASHQQPGNLTILHALAEAYQLTDLREKSQKTAKSALKLAPQDAANILWYADFKTRHNEPEEAVKALKDALQLMPNRTDLKLWLSKCLIADNAIEESKEILEALIDDSKTKPGQLHQAAYLCVQINALELSVQALDKSTRLVKAADPILIMDLARCYTLLEEHKAALDTLNLPKILIEKTPELALLKSDLLCELGQYELAYSTLKMIDIPSESTFNTKSSPLLYSFDFSLKGYYYRLGQLLRAMGEIEESQAAISKALTEDPQDAQVRNACSAAYFAGIDFTNALRVCQEAETQETNTGLHGQENLDLLCTQAEILLYQNDIQSANDLIANRTFSDSSSARILALKSRLSAANGEIESAQIYFDRSRQSYENEWEDAQPTTLSGAFDQSMTLQSLAEAGLNLDDYEQANYFQSQAHALFSNQPLFNWRYAALLVKFAQTQQIASLVSVTVHAPGASLLSEEAHLLCQEQLGKCKDSLSEDTWICLNSQDIAIQSGEWPLNLNVDACLISPEVAVTVIINCQDSALVKDILDSYPEDLQILQAYGLHALRYGKDDGVQYIEKALQMNVSNPINHALLALLNWHDPELALRSLDSALQFWPDEPKWHALAGQLYTQIGDTDSASRHIQEALSVQPENADYWQQSADLRIRSNDLEQAKADLEKSASIQSEDAQIWVKMADINQRMGNLSEAMENLHTATAIAPEDKRVALQEVKFLIDQEHFSDAENKAMEILDADETDEQAQIYLARSQAKQGKFDSALGMLASAAEKNPNNPKLKLESIKINKSRKGAESALPELIALAQAYPDDPDVLTILTEMLIQTNRLEEAEETAQTILRIIPEQAEVHLMLGRLQRKNGKLDQAITHLSEAIQYQPSLIEAYLELGKTYQERRNLEEAIRVFQEGTKVNSSDPRPYYHAGMALKDCKDYAAAETMLKQAKRHAPTDTNIIRQLGVVTALNLVNNLREVRKP